MPAPLIAAAGAAARGVAVGARVAAQAAMTGVRAGAKGVSGAARGTEKGAEGAVKTTAAAARTGVRTVGQLRKAAYRTGRAVAKTAREARTNNEVEKYGYSTHGNAKRFNLGDPRRSLARAYNAAPIPGVVKRAALEMGPMGTKRLAARMGIIERAPSFARRRRLINKARSFAGMQKQGEEKPRISKTEGRVMIGVAILFDLLPILFIVGPVLAIFANAGDNPDCAWDGKLWNYLACKTGEVANSLAGVVAIIALIGLAPIIYSIASFFSMIFGILVFGVWFKFRGVSPLSLGMFMLFEALPVVNLLPMYTAAVWRCVRGAQREDARWATYASPQIKNRPAGLSQEEFASAPA